MLSRALPVHFNTTQTLPPPYPAPQSFACSYSPPVSSAQMDTQEGMSRLANCASLSHESVNPQGPSINFGHGAGDQRFTPPLMVTNSLSPISPTGTGATSGSPIEGANHSHNNTHVESLNSPTNFLLQPHQSRVQIEERIHSTRSQSTVCLHRNSLPPYVGTIGLNHKSIPPQRLNEALLPGIESTGQHDPAAPNQLRFSCKSSPSKTRAAADTL